MLAQGHGNICAVGDPDQSIYSWRGADVQNILSFEQDFPEAEIIQLEQNYRSTSVILRAANGVIENNRARKPKNLWTERTGGARVIVRGHLDDRDEAGWVARNIYRQVSQGGRYDDNAIFYRTNAQSRVFEEALRRAGIPYRLLGGVRFYERREIKDMLAYLRLLVNPYDTVALDRVINVPPRGIGKSTIGSLSERARISGCSPYEIIETIEAHESFKSTVRRRLLEFRSLLNDLRSVLLKESLTALWRQLIDRTGYSKWLTDSGVEGLEDRLANLEELGRAMREAVHDPNVEGSPLQQFLDQVSLVSDIDQLEQGGGEVLLMTVHLAKGLEFPKVFVVGLEEGLFPHSSALDDPDEMEEERRLCYVAMTRAKDELTLCYAERRFLHGREQYNIPSRFLDEISEEYISRERVSQPEWKSAVSAVSAERKFGFDVGDESMVEDNQRAIGDFDFDQRSADEQVAELCLGARVAHDIFGPGTVRKISGTNDRRKIVVQFDRVGIKTLMVAYANLNVLG